MTSPKLPRRSFLKGALLAGASIAAAPHVLASTTGSAPVRASGRVNIALCGIGNRGREIAKDLNATGLINVVALCDCDMGAPQTREIINLFPNAPRYTDV